jgi:sulfofructose kinase
MTPPSIVCVGLATLDTIALVPSHPTANGRVVASNITVAGGGPAATAAVTAARLGMRAAFVGRVGTDDVGTRILTELEAHGVDVSGVTTDKGHSSALSAIIVDQTTADRTICTAPQAPLALEPSGPAHALVEQADWVHADHLGWPALAAFRRLPPLSLDAGNPVEDLDLTRLDLYAPTVDQLRSRYGARPADELVAEAVAEGAKTVVATDGSRGSWGATHEAEVCHIPAEEISPLSTLGAGDVYHGALVSAIASGRPLADAMRLASVVAALSCRALDGRSGIPDLAEVERLGGVQSSSGNPNADGWNMLASDPCNDHPARPQSSC